MKKLLLASFLMLGSCSIIFAQEKVKEKNGVVKTKTAQGKTKENKMTGEIKKKEVNGTVTKTKLDMGKVTADKIKPVEKTTKTKTADTKTKTVQTMTPAVKEEKTGMHDAVKKKVKKEPVQEKK